tara:strand:- start:5051 stop:5920 length:870 start_codon:yes stop_codon:yes gene_type:complete
MNTLFCRRKCLKAPNFLYYEATTIEEAVKYKFTHEDSVFLAGGQSLMPTLNMRLSTPSSLIDINQIKDLKKIDIQNNFINIGALCTHSELMTNELINKHFPSLPNILKHVAHPAIRNKGTHGGSIAYADPAAELPALAIALNAEFTLVGKNGKRIVSANDFYIGLFETELKNDEIITNIKYPKVMGDDLLLFEEIVRRHGDYAMAGIISSIKREGKNVSEIKLVFFGISDKPKTAEEVSKYLISNNYEYEVVKKILKSDIEFTSDINSSPEMKAHLSTILIEKIFNGLK